MVEIAENLTIQGAMAQPDVVTINGQDGARPNDSKPEVELDEEEMEAILLSKKQVSKGVEVDPDSLSGSEGDETVKSTRDQETNTSGEDREVADVFANDPDPSKVAASRGSASRASIASQKSISFFVDFDGQEKHRQQPQTRSKSARSGQRMTQSMYVVGSSDTGSDPNGVSFFVDLGGSGGKNGKMVKSMSREEPNADLNEISDQMSEKTKQLLSKNLEQTKTFFKKLKGYIDFLQAPSYSKEELKQKRLLAESITTLMFEEERRLGQGKDFVGVEKLEKLALPKSQASRPLSAVTNFLNVDEDRPVPLRRERTFDLSDPKTSNAKVFQSAQVVDIPLDW